MISSHTHSTCHRQAQGRRDAGDAVAVGRAACAGHGASPVVAGAVGGGTAAGAGCWDAEGSEHPPVVFGMKTWEEMGGFHAKTKSYQSYIYVYIILYNVNPGLINP